MSLPQTDTLLEVSQASKRYRKTYALNKVSFALDSGGIYGLLGPNGSGKTTCLHLITGLIQPTQGAITLNGIAVQDKRSRALIGFAPDDLPLPASLTGGEYLDLHDRLRGRDDSDRARALACALGIKGDLHRQISEYSHGMKRKIQIVAAAMHRPELLILDEPFRGLDPDAAFVLRDLMQTFTASGRTILIATHDMLRAERDCRTVLILHKGHLVDSGAPENLHAKHGVRDMETVFLKATGVIEGRQERLETIESAFTSK
ncbi:ABC transporter ATP-binding protein [Nocardiopsis alba]|jgi:ABC-2 type transport system ATP-binding protein|uniref:ABC transporter ATP-binding protein n=1 Tax=Nocardiopsis alba TaxID=53437 RepID=UPI0033AA455B